MERDSVEALRRRLTEAEQRAKKREQVDLAAVENEEAKANEKGFTLIKSKSVNRARFSQAITENIECLQQHDYLTNAEKAFVFDLMPYVQMNTHAIASPKTGQYYTVSELARLLKRSRTGTSLTIDELIQKGIMFEFVNVREIKNYGRSVTERPFYMNPEIVCCGDRDKIDAGITDLIVHYGILEKKGILLPWRLAREPNAKYGKLVKREVQKVNSRKRK